MINYLEQYKSTEMYQSMSSVADPLLGLGIVQKETIYKLSNFENIITTTRFKDTRNNILKWEEQEHLKRVGSLLRSIGYIDEGIMLIDLAHWYRYLETEKGEMEFLDYVHRKYNNIGLKTH